MTAFAARALETMGVAAARADARTVVVVGNGMVGHRFCERLATHDRDRRLRIVCFGEERRAAYDRVHLTAYMSGKNADALVLADAAWYASCGITLHLGERVIEIDRTARTVVSSAGRRVAYDALVLATGSAPFVPAIPGVETRERHRRMSADDAYVDFRQAALQLREHRREEIVRRRLGRPDADDAGLAVAVLAEHALHLPDLVEHLPCALQ